MIIPLPEARSPHDYLERVKEEEIVEPESAQRCAGPKVPSRRHGRTVIGLARVGG
jgi:hypothetical protein